MTLEVLDATATKQGMSTTLDASNNLVGSTCVTDPSSEAKALVGQTHNSDTVTLTGNSVLDAAVGILWNGTSFDRARCNTDAQTSPVTISGMAAGTVTSNNLTNHNHRGATIGVNITQISAATTLQVTVQGFDFVSGQYYTILQTTSIGSISFTLLTVYPGVTVASNSAVSTILPRTWRISATVAGSGTVTATIGMSAVV